MYNNRFYVHRLYWPGKASGFVFIPVFKYVAEKYLQKLKQQIAENPESMHSSSNKIGKYPESFSPMFTWQIYFPFIIIFTLKDTVCSFL